MPQELTYKGQFIDHLENYCTGNVQAQSAEELLLGKPYPEDGKIFFRLEGLMNYLRNKRFDEYTRAQIQERIKEVNGGEESHGVKNFKTVKNEWKSARVWWVPEFSGEVDIPDVYVETSEVPF